MSRPGRRAPLSIAAAALIALALPAAAHAAAFTIKAGDGPCVAAGDVSCGSFPEASAGTALSAGLDTVSVTSGSYAAGTTFASQVQITGEPGVVVNGGLTFSGAGASVLDGVSVIQAGAAAAIVVNGAGGLAISDVTAISLGDDGIQLLASTANSIERSSVFTGVGAKSAVRVDADNATVGLTISSSIVAGGFAGIGGYTPNVVGGTATVTARHVTAVGSTHGMYIDGGPLGLGTVTMTVSDSIVFSSLIQDLVPGSAINFDAESLQTGDDDALFADPASRNYRLRPGSPAINAGNALVGGESTTDIDGETRAGPTTDLGGDEYFNTAPKAAIKVTTPLPRDGQPVAFDGTGSRDQPGGGIASYKWEFGDGTTATTTAPTTSHTYKGEGSVTAKLTVVDGEGASSAPASVGVTIFDGTIPSVTISKPKSKQKIFEFVRKTKTVTKNGKKVKIKVKTKKRTRIKFAGAATDKSGIARVLLTVEKTASTGTTSVVQGSQSSTKKCRWLDPKKGLKRTSCAKPILISAKFKESTWAYNVRSSIKLSKGTYRAIVYGLDKTGSFGNSAAKSKRNITFTIK